MTRAQELGYAALALTDECSVAGVVRAHTALKELPPEAAAQAPRLLIGTEVALECGLRCVALAVDRRGYGQICRLIDGADAPRGAEG